MSYFDQDWKPVVFTKTGFNNKPLTGEAALKAAARSGAQLDTHKREQGGKNKQNSGSSHSGNYKLDNETDALKHNRISKESSQAVVKARIAKGMTQVQLAAAIFESVTTVQTYENGTAIPNGNILGKLSRALGVTIRK